MNWKKKAKLQNLMARFPSAISFEAYYQMQRWFGGLRNSRLSLKRIRSAAKMWELTRVANFDPVGKVFFEVGTGRTLSMPVAYWLMGAGSTITVDLNPYLKSEITYQLLNKACENEEQIRNFLGNNLIDDRLSELKQFLKKPFQLAGLMELCNIQYQAPSDAANTGLPDNTVDVHTSFTVYEHIPADILKAISLEGNRIVKDDGLFVHGIDYSDHFSHSDKSISPINFLRYSQDDWDKFADNRYMYMNRLRHDDYLKLFESCEQELVHASTETDEKSLELLNSQQFQVHEKFAGKSKVDLATTWASLVLRPRKK